MLLEYTLKVNGKSLKKFIESQAKNTRVWHPEVGGRSHRVVLGRWCNGNCALSLPCQ